MQSSPKISTTKAVSLQQQRQQQQQQQHQLGDRFTLFSRSPVGRRRHRPRRSEDSLALHHLRGLVRHNELRIRNPGYFRAQLLKEWASGIFGLSYRTFVALEIYP